MFFGSIVLIKDEGKPHADVIDGQQGLDGVIQVASVATSREEIGNDIRAGTRAKLTKKGSSASRRARDFTITAAARMPKPSVTATKN